MQPVRSRSHSPGAQSCLAALPISCHMSDLACSSRSNALGSCASRGFPHLRFVAPGFLYLRSQLQRAPTPRHAPAVWLPLTQLANHTRVMLPSLVVATQFLQLAQWGQFHSAGLHCSPFVKLAPARPKLTPGRLHCCAVCAGRQTLHKAALGVRWALSQAGKCHCPAVGCTAHCLDCTSVAARCSCPTRLEHFLSVET